MYTPYQSRPTEFLGIETLGHHRVKLYAIRFGERPLDRSRFAGGWALAEDVVAPLERTPGRPGLGFVILHQGATGDYVVVCWWDRENELPTRVFVRDDAGWRLARHDESFCVWDLTVIGQERDSYVATVLADRTDGPADYLAREAHGENRS